MSLIIMVFVVSLVVSTAAFAIILPGCADVYARFRRGRIVNCPDTNQQSTISVSAGLAAASSVFLPTRLHVRDCSLWPQRRCCARGCLRQMRPLVS